MTDVIIVGAGATGLVSANVLYQAGLQVVVIDREPTVGGRLATDNWGGLQFDRGFQVLLTAYPAVQKWLDLPALECGAFAPGAQVLLPGGGRSIIGDPLRQPSTLLNTLANPVGTLLDKTRLLALVAYVRSRKCEQLFTLSEESTQDFLNRWGFSARFIERFFRPFYGGIFLERELSTSQRLFLFTFKMFAEGQAVLPKGGLQAVAQQLADRLPANFLQLDSPVVEITSTSASLAEGGVLKARAVIDCSAVPNPLREQRREWRRTINVYFSTPTTALNPEFIALLPDYRPVNNVAVVSGAQASYALPGEHLVSVSLFAKANRSLEEYASQVKATLEPWLGRELDDWTPLRHYDIPYALPQGKHVVWTDDASRWRDDAGVWRAGDYLLHPSLQGAMHAGELVGQAVLDALGDSSSEVS